MNAQNQRERAVDLEHGVRCQVAIFVARDYPEDDACQLTRLGIAVYRGLLPDLVTTGDERAVNAAAHRYIDAMFGA